MVCGENQGDGQPAFQGLGTPVLSVELLAGASGSHWRLGLLGRTELLGFPLLPAPLILSTPTPNLHFMVGEELENPLTHIKSWDKPVTMSERVQVGRESASWGKTYTWCLKTEARRGWILFGSGMVLLLTVRGVCEKGNVTLIFTEHERAFCPKCSSGEAQGPVAP